MVSMTFPLRFYNAFGLQPPEKAYLNKAKSLARKIEGAGRAAPWFRRAQRAKDAIGRYEQMSGLVGAMERSTAFSTARISGMQLDALRAAEPKIREFRSSQLDIHSRIRKVADSIPFSIRPLDESMEEHMDWAMRAGKMLMRAMDEPSPEPKPAEPSVPVPAAPIATGDNGDAKKTRTR